MAPRLKVFTWSDGFHSHPVAVSSRAKALAAWGVEQDLFKSGYAREVTAGPDYEAAMASPGEVMRRGEAIDVGKVSPTRKPSKPAGPTAAQKAKVKKLEADLAELDLAWQAEEAELSEAREMLERKARQAADQHQRARATLRQKLSSARKAISN
ncbi:MAG TPA: hypothetical protein VN018_07835 [Brevundimonas sp.]|nr:hypothetical protein [Brevundimonas sp.]